MPSRPSRSADGRLFVTTRLPDRTIRHRVDGLQDIGRYEQSRDVLRRRAEASGGTLDSADADAVWAARQAARRRFDEAFAWWQGDTLGRPHPGSLTDWMDDA